MKLFQEKSAYAISRRKDLLATRSFEACLNNFLSIPVCEALQFSPSSARIYAHSFDPGSKMERCDSKD